jgi:hypothetical protein
MALGLAITFAIGCSRGSVNPQAAAATFSAASPAAIETPKPNASSGGYVGFDRNDYPGDGTMASMKSQFAFVGYWLTNPPGESANSWVGKRETLKRQGWGFLLLADGRLEAEILKTQKTGVTPETLAKQDAATAVAAARSEGFPKHAILFLDQEEGGRLTDPQAAYLLAWTEAVAATDYKPGVYASGQTVSDGPGAKIDTIEDIRARVKAGGLHEVAMFDAQDSCGPSNGCTQQPPPLSQAGEPGLIAWQYSQSPRRPSITRSCARTYAADGNCYALGFGTVFLDMDLAQSSDPSNAR